MTEHPLDQLDEYALRLLAPESEAFVSEHVAECAECSARLLDIQQTLGLLAYHAPIYAPPADAEERLIARINVLRQAERAPRSIALESRPALVTADAVAAELTTGDTAPAPASTGPVIGTASPAPLRRLGWYRLRRATWPSRVVYGLAAVAAVLLLAVGTLGANLIASRATSARLQQQVQADQTALALFSDSDATVRQLKVTEPQAGGAEGRMAMNPQTNQGVLVVLHLPQLAHDRTYQLWLVHDATVGAGGTREDVTPVGTFNVDATGSAIVRFTSSTPISAVSNAGISIERSGGAAHPDSPMIMLLA